MGKKSKKSNVEVAPAAVSVPPAKSAKKGKRDAEEVIEKPVNAKKQKVEVTVPKQKDDRKSKKEDTPSSESEEEVKVPAKKSVKLAKVAVEESSSSEEDASSDEDTNTKAAVQSKKLTANGAKNGTAAVSNKRQESSDSDSDDSSDEKIVASIKKPSGTVATKKQESSNSSSEGESDSSDDDDESNVAKVTTPAKTAPTASKVPPTNGSKKEKSNDSSESESDSDDNAALAKKPSKVKAEESSDESSDENSDESDEEPQNKKLKALDAIPKNVGKPTAKAVSQDISSDEEDDNSDESSDDEPPKSQQNKKSSSSEDESEDESEESEDEQPMKTPKKDEDVKMEDAMKSEKKGIQTPASNQSQNYGSKTLFVGNLSYDVGEDDVVEFFKEAGEVIDVRFSKDADGRFKGFGHAEFATQEAAQKAMEMNGQELLGRGVKLDFARERGAYTPYSGGQENNSYQKGGKGQSHTIFVRGFDKSLEVDKIESSLKEYFGSCGEITRVSLPKDYETGSSKGIAYMDFKDKDAFSKAMELNGSELGDYSLTVEEAKPRSDSRDGAGWSGGRGSGRDSRGRGGGRFGGQRGGGRGRGGRGGGGRGRGRR